MLRAAAGFAIALTATSSWLFAQVPSQAAFDVASVRLASSAGRVTQRVTDTRVDFINLQVRGLLFAAFRVSEHRLVAPDWVRDVRVDINAMLPPGATRAQVPGMLQSLLRQRFGAEWHSEQRPLEAYELLVGPDGISMREVPPLDELAADPPSGAIGSDRTSESIDGPYRSFLTPAGATVVTATTRYTQSARAGGVSVLDAKRMTMDELAEVLQFTMDAPVVNRTGLSGGYEFNIELPRPATVERLMMSRGMTTSYNGTPIAFGSGVSAGDELKNIGLRLERLRTPVNVIVIDKLERTPTEN